MGGGYTQILTPCTHYFLLIVSNPLHFVHCPLPTTFLQTTLYAPLPPTTSNQYYHYSLHITPKNIDSPPIFFVLENAEDLEKKLETKGCGRLGLQQTPSFPEGSTLGSKERNQKIS